MEQAHAFAGTQPGFARTAVIGLLGILLVLFVLRPVARQVTETLREPLPIAAGKETASLEAGPIKPEVIEPTAPINVTLPERPRAKELSQQRGIFEQVAEHIRREPAQSTRLLEAWIGSSEEMEG